MTQTNNDNINLKDVLYLQLNKNINDDDSKSNNKDGQKSKKGKKGKKCKKKADKGSKKLNKELKKTEKIRARIEKIIKLCEKKRKHHENEIQKMNKKQLELQNLLQNSNGMDFNALKTKLMQIIKKNKALRCKKNKDLTTTQQFKMEMKFKKKKDKEKRKKEKEQKKLEKKQKKKERKEQKMEKQKKLENARVNSLPNILNKKEHLLILIDGHNIMGCDQVCRKLLRNKSSKRAKERLCLLVYNFFTENNLNVGYEIKLNVYFDGYGKGYDYKGVFPVIFSGKNKIVDDMLVERYINNKNKPDNVLVITSDKGLTLRLFDCGVKIMKSGVFYKNYLAMYDKNNGQINTDDVKDNDINIINTDNNNNNNNNKDDDDDVDIPFDTLRLAIDDNNDNNDNDNDDDKDSSDNSDNNNNNNDNTNKNNEICSDMDDDIDGEFDMIEKEINEGIPDEYEGIMNPNE